MIRSGAPRASASRAPQRAAASPTSLPSTPTTTSRAGGSLAVGRAAGAVAGGRSDVVGVGVDTAHLRGNGAGRCERPPGRGGRSAKKGARRRGRREDLFGA